MSWDGYEDVKSRIIKWFDETPARNMGITNLQRMVMAWNDETLQLDLSQDITKGMSQDNTLENRLLKLLSHDVSHDVSHDEKNAIASLKDAENLRIIRLTAAAL